jgi:hypothetical protein
MKASDRIALIYGISLAGAGAASYFRGRRGQDLVVDTVFHGAIVGTGLNVVAWHYAGDETSLALNNEGVQGMGKMPQKAVKLLENVNVDTLYADLKENGVKVAPIPANPSMVIQDPD